MCFQIIIDFSSSCHDYIMQESDIFSLGVLLWEMWADHPPWPGLTASQLGRVLIQDGQRLPLTNNHIPMAPILKSCFGPPVARLPATQVCSPYSEGEGP